MSTAAPPVDWERIVGQSWNCEGPDMGRAGMTSCDGGPTLFRGRRARWWYKNTRPVCGTCKRVIIARQEASHG